MQNYFLLNYLSFLNYVIAGTHKYEFYATGDILANFDHL